MTTYITAVRNDGFDPFNTKAKDMHITVICNSLAASIHVFYIMTGLTKYTSVTMSTSCPGKIDLNMYDTDVMKSDEFILSEL